MRIQTINPATGNPLQTYETMPDERILAILDRSHDAFRKWRNLAVAGRAALLPDLARVLRERGDEYALHITREMGKTITESRAEIEKCAWLCEVYAEHAAEWLRDEVVQADGLEHRITHEPLGVILAVMPWNFPFWQVIRFAVPTLTAGNTCLLKHARNVPACAMAIEESFILAGFPADTFRTLLAGHGGVQRLIAEDRVRGVSLTGSTEAGIRIAQAAGEALKPVVLELGGSDPFVVLEDADPEFTALNAVRGRMVATGQSCIAAKRFIVVEQAAGPFIEAFVRRMRALVVGDPEDERTEVGAIVDERSLRELLDQVDDAVCSGARVLTGGKRIDREGFFLEPTVIEGVSPEMRITREEIFGPVAPIMVVKDEEEAVALANSTEFGLGGSVWTSDTERGKRVARRIEAGTVFVNSIVKSDPRMPFGGVKKSGLGRELGRHGLLAFVNVKGLNVYPHG